MVREVEEQLRAGGFPEPPPRDDSMILDGVRITIVARLGGKVDQLTDSGASSPMLDYLSRFATRYGRAARR